MNDLIATWVDPANLTRRTTRAAVTGIGKFLGGMFYLRSTKMFSSNFDSQKEGIRKKSLI